LRKEWLDDWLQFMHQVGKPVTRIPIMAKSVGCISRYWNYEIRVNFFSICKQVLDLYDVSGDFVENYINQVCTPFTALSVSCATWWPGRSHQQEIMARNHQRPEIAQFHYIRCVYATNTVSFFVKDNSYPFFPKKIILTEILQICQIFL
jgi:hypothetical protein